MPKEVDPNVYHYMLLGHVWALYMLRILTETSLLVTDNVLHPRQAGMGALVIVQLHDSHSLLLHMQVAE